LRQICKISVYFHHMHCDILITMPLEFVVCLDIQDKSDREILLLSHFSANIIASTKLIAESLALSVNKNPSNSP